MGEVFSHEPLTGIIPYARLMPVPQEPRGPKGPGKLALQQGSDIRADALGAWGSKPNVPRYTREAHQRTIWHQRGAA